MGSFAQEEYVRADEEVAVMQEAVEVEDEVEEVLPPRRRQLPSHLRDGTYVLY